MRATHLRSVSITDPDPDGLADFYEQVWGLLRTGEHEGVTYLRGTGPEHHILAIHPGEQSSIRGYSLGLADADTVDAAARELVDHSETTVVRGPAPLPQPGGGYGLVITDPDGREIELSAEVENAPTATHQRPGSADEAQPCRLEHDKAGGLRRIVDGHARLSPLRRNRVHAVPEVQP